MHILVTGASGFLGTALCRTLRGGGHEIVELNSRNCDLTRADALEAWRTTRFDRIFHLAAWTQAGDFCLYHPGEQWVINQQINTHVLAWWQKHQAQAKLISIGTSCSYDPALELKEDNYLVGTPIESLYTYAMTKRMLQVGLSSLARQFDLKHLTLVPSTLYGPGYHTDGRQMHFIFDLVRKILRGRYHGEPVVLWGDGLQRRELVYLEDFVTLALRLADDRENEIVNIGAGVEHTIRDFATAICGLTGYEFERIQFDTTRYVGARSKCLDVARLRAIVPDFRMTALQDGLAATVEWFLRERAF